MVNVYLSSARNTALVNRRSCGVALVTARGIPQCAMTLEQAEMPPPYAGDDMTAVAAVTPNYGGLRDDTYTVRPYVAYMMSSTGGTNTCFTPGLIHGGDTIQFNYQGPWYTIWANDPNDPTKTAVVSPLLLSADTTQNQFDLTQGQRPLTPWGNWQSASSGAMPVPYRISRQPLYTKSAAATLELPSGAVIDLAVSGFETTDWAPAPAPLPSMQTFYSASTTATTTTTSTAATTPPVYYIMFSASGGIDALYIGGVRTPVNRPIFLMIGKTEQARRDPSGNSLGVLNKNTGRPTTNDEDLDNLWVVINPQTGVVSTAPVGAATDQRCMCAVGTSGRAIECGFSSSSAACSRRVPA